MALDGTQTTNTPAVVPDSQTPSQTPPQDVNDIAIAKSLAAHTAPSSSGTPDVNDIAIAKSLGKPDPTAQQHQQQQQPAESTLSKVIHAPSDFGTGVVSELYNQAKG